MKLLIALISFSCTPSKLDTPALALTDHVTESLSLEKILRVDSTTSIHNNGFQSFGSIKNAFWLKKQLLLHTNFPTTLSLLDENFKVIQQLVPDEDNPYTINGITSVCTHKDKVVGTSGVSDNFYKTAQFEDLFDFIMQMRTTNYAYRHFNLMANDSKIKLVFERAGQFYHSIYDINKKTTRTFQSLTSPTLSTTPIDGDQLDFFVSLYGSNQALCLLPYEYLAEQPATFLNQNSTYLQAVESHENVLLFTTFK